MPVVAHPLAFDQKGSTARLIHHRLGERMQLRQSALNAQVARMLSDHNLKNRLDAIAQTVPAAGGITRAIEIIEAALAG